jgi:serine/threonine protein kinase
MSAAADRNLLFGVLALQMDFITQDALVNAMHSWVLNKDKPLGDILLSQGALAADDRNLLDALIRRHLEKHGNDAQKSLSVLNNASVVRQDLEEFADPELDASLAHIPATWGTQGSGTGTRHSGAGVRVETEDPYPTRYGSVPPSSLAGGRFRLLRPLARGGLGAVSVAHDEELHREVALKEIRQEYVDHPESRTRFLREAEITGRLEHPGIVPVYSLGTHADGRPYYAMRLIRGESFKEAIERFHQGDLPGQDVAERTLVFHQLLRRFIDACQAVAYAHSQGVLHRDLKPENIMLGPYGETLVVDWGLAKVLRREEMGSAPCEALPPLGANELPYTRAGAVFGTFQYMSPEQAAGRTDRVGAASDVYSLGATLYCLLTGRPPFTDTDAAVIVNKIQAGEFPPPRKIKGWISPPLEAVCLEAMALQPEDRYQSPLGLVDDLIRLFHGKPISAQAALAARVRFEQCFTPELAEQIAAQPNLLEGREAEITLLFAGIQDFSRISERLGPHHTFQFVRDVMDTLSESVHTHDGAVVDCIGDEVMAMWGAPVTQANHAALACRAALSMLDRVSGLKERWEGVLGLPPRLAIGIHTGNAQVGSTGSHRSFKYGPLGNAVAITSGLKAATKHLRTSLLMSGATRAQLGDSFTTRRLCDVRIAEVPVPLQLHELVPDYSPGWSELATRYGEALLLFEQTEFHRASRVLGELLTAFPDDGPSLVLMARTANAMVGGSLHPGMGRAAGPDQVWELPAK